MQWQLAHFGLELGNGFDYFQQSSVLCDQYLEDIDDISVNDVKRVGSVLDNMLDTPRTDKHMRKTFGVIQLATPIVRPECLDQICDYYPDLEKMGNKNQVAIYTVGPNKERKSGKDLLHRLKAGKKQILIHGNQFIEHNVMAYPEEMMLTSLPVPSFAVCGTTDNKISSLRKKLNSILAYNNLLESILEGETGNDSSSSPSLSVIDVIDILTWQVYTYLDNAIPGIASDPYLERGVAQMLGTPVEDPDFIDRNAVDIAGTSLQRIVRGINMGESALQVVSDTQRDTSNNLAFELSKQVVFNRIWKKSKFETNIIHIDEVGEVYRTENGIIRDYTWDSLDGYSKIPRDLVVWPKYSKRRISTEKYHEELDAILEKLYEIDPDYSLSIPQHRTLSYLYGIIDGMSIREQQVVICDVKIDEILLRPLIKKLKNLNEAGDNICLILRRNSLENIGRYVYTTTPDSYRNLIIALTDIKERQQFLHKEELFNHIKQNDLQLLSTYFEGFNRDEITRIVGSSIIAKSRVDVNYIQGYVLQILKEENRNSNHVRPRQRKRYRKLTLEEIYSEANRRFVEVMNESDSKIKKGNFDNSKAVNSSDDGKQKKSLYDSLKGMDPLIHWVKNKGRLFSPAAKEYGFKNYPRGLLLTGVPGCGKTMAAKIIADEWDMNLRRVKVDDIISRYVGQNEENMSKLLKELEENEPIICFVDEAEKLFTEMTTNHQNHATLSQNAVESMLLQFMEENEKRVFFIFTANDITKLSAPIIDRFDACFFVDLPTKEARSEIIQLMLEERKKGKLGINYDSLADKSLNFTGRDIRSAVEEAMMNSFADGRELTQEDLEDTFSKSISTAETHADRITHLRNLVKEGKIRSANTDYKTKAAASKTIYDPNVA